MYLYRSVSGRVNFILLSDYVHKSHVFKLLCFSPVFLKGGGKKEHHCGSEQTAVLSRGDYLQVTWSSECLIRYTEQKIDMLSIVSFFVSSLV